MPLDLKDLSNIFGADIVKEIYKDGLSGSTKEIGRTLTDFIKAARLFTAPLQLAASFQDRLEKRLVEVTNRVPLEKQIPAQAAFVGPILEKLKYTDDSHYLREHYLNLLEKSIHADKVMMTHPAFPNIVHQLAPDEVQVLEALRKGDMLISLEYRKDRESNKKIDEIILSCNVDLGFLAFPHLRRMYMEHLQMLNLLVIKSEIPESYNLGQDKFTRTMRYQLAEFGVLFLVACSR